jgi:hypothetical protein
MIDGTEEITTTTKYPTWGWVAAVFLGIIMLLVAAGITNMSDTMHSHAAQLKALEDKKVDKEAYRCDMADIKASLKTLIDMHLKGNGGKK